MLLAFKRTKVFDMHKGLYPKLALIVNKFITYYNITGPVHENFVFISPYAKGPLISIHAEVSSRVRGLIFGLRLHVHPCFLYGSSKGSLESLLLADLISTKIMCICPIICYSAGSNL